MKKPGLGFSSEVAAVPSHKGVFSSTSQGSAAQSLVLPEPQQQQEEEAELSMEMSFGDSFLS